MFAPHPSCLRQSTFPSRGRLILINFFMTGAPRQVLLCFIPSVGIREPFVFRLINACFIPRVAVKMTYKPNVIHLIARRRYLLAQCKGRSRR